MFNARSARLLGARAAPLGRHEKEGFPKLRGLHIYPRLAVSSWRWGRPPLAAPDYKDNPAQTKTFYEAQDAGDKFLYQAGGVSLTLGPLAMGR
jgi:hypothetical protein